MDGHPQATVVLFPCSLSQGFKEATMGITICLFVYLFVCLFVCLFICLFVYLFVCFSCSTERSKRGECCIHALSPWRMASVGLMHNLSKMMVIPDSAGDAS
jgi:hypothetical protein